MSLAPIEHSRAAIERLGEELRHAQLEAGRLGDKELVRALQDALNGLQEYVMDEIAYLLRERARRDEPEPYLKEGRCPSWSLPKVV